MSRWRGRCRRGPWRRLTRLVVIGAACTLASSCFGSPDASSPSRPAPSTPAAGAATGSPVATPSPTPEPPPRAGACRRLFPDDLRRIVDESPTVPCRRKHTLVTFAVDRLPERVARVAVAPGDRAVEAAADRVCTSRFRDRVGGSRTERKLSMLTPTYFLPSGEQFALGARWVRCDVYAYATPERLATLPRRVDGALERDRVRDRFGTCSQVSPSRRRFHHVACLRPHHWRAVGTARLGRAKEAYPGARRVQERARSRCEAPVRRYLDTNGSFSYGFEVPRRDTWAEGERLALCWARTAQ